MSARLTLWVGLLVVCAAGAPSWAALSDFSVGVVYTEPGTGKTLPYRLHLPDNYDSSKSYPLIMLMHGLGESGNNNTSQADTSNSAPGLVIAAVEQPGRNAFVLAPQCPTTDHWTNVDFGAGTYYTLPTQSDSERIAMKILASVQSQYNINSKRLYLTGLSMGGYASWELAERNPTKFAAVVPVCGAGDPSYAWKITNVPIWAFHNTGDPTVPSQGTVDMMTAIGATGHAQATYYPVSAHDAWSAAYSDQAMWNWMFTQGAPEPGVMAILTLAVPALLRRRRGRIGSQ
jgi:predicted peptidase